MPRLTFDRAVLLILLAAALVVAFLIIRGDRVGLEIVELSPAADADGVSTQAPIRIRFDQPLLPANGTPIRLSPTVSGTFQWQGDSLIFHPAAPLQPQTDYTVQLSAGLEGERGRQLLDAHTWRFRTGAPRILYLAWEGDDPSQIYAISPDGGPPVRLTYEETNVLDFSPSPDGLSIAYSTIRPTGGADLLSIPTSNTDESEEPSLSPCHLVTLSPCRLLDCAGAACTAPVWSPHGRRLVYERRGVDGVGGGPGAPRLWWLDTATGETARVFQDSQWLGLGARFSPDGRWLSYVASLSQEIQLYDLETEEIRFAPSQTGELPTWSPDSQSLYYTEVELFESGYGTYIMRLDVETGETISLSGGGTINDSHPAVSPNSEWIAFTRQSEPGQARQLWLMRADGSDARPLTDDPDLDHRFPRWSPDGQTLLVEWFPIHDPTAEPTLGLIDIASGERHPLVSPGTQAIWLP